MAFSILPASAQASTAVCTECMARPRFASGFIRVGLSSLQQCIRPMSIRSGHDGDPRELVLIKLSAYIASPFRYSDFQNAGRLLGHLVIVLSQRHSPGMKHHITSSAIGIASIAISPSVEFALWAYAINLSHQRHLGRTALPND